MAAWIELGYRSAEETKKARERLSKVLERMRKRDIVDRLRDAAEVEGGASPDYSEMLEEAADTIAALIAERDEAVSTYCNILSDMTSLEAERDEWNACFLSMREERDDLLKDRADLAKQIDNDTDCIARLKEANGLDVIPTLAAAYKEIAALKEEVERLNAQLDHNFNLVTTIKAEKSYWKNQHRQLVERVSVLTEALQTVRAAIIEKAPDTLWAGLIETAVDHIDNALSRTSEDAK